MSCLILLSLLMCGCSGVHIEREAISTAPSWSAIYDRAGIEFGDTFLLKPRVGPAPTAELTLAPLILKEVSRDRSGRAGDGLKPLEFYRATGRSEDAAVYFKHGQVSWGGRWQRQITYYWYNRTNGAAGKDCVLPLQGVRMTLDSAGAPVVWEVLGDCTGAEVFFIAQSLETAARAQFGMPASGRRFSVERSMAEAPNTVVARVLDDGPVPMGPIVYVREGTGEVGTLICRCMPAQARRLSGESVYELIEVDDAAEAALLGEAAGGGRPAEAFSIEQWLWPDRLIERLRLPLGG